jgi:L,D-transpeptidase ErfK/SrfK
MFRRLFILILTFIWPIASLGLSFDLPKNNDSVVGEVQVTQVKEDEGFSDVAMRFDVGYYEIFDANPGINPDTPTQNVALVVPTQYILPLELKPGVIIINLAEMRLYFQPPKEKRVYIYPIGIGKEDWETPLGEMTIVKKTKNPTWVVPDSIYKFRLSIGDKIEKVMPPGPDNPMGKYALRLSASSSGSYAIHGTNIPESVGRRTSAGCIRLYDADIEALFKQVKVGTKVIIVNKPYKAGWLGNKLYFEAHMPLFEQRILKGDDLKQAKEVVSNALKGRNVLIDLKKVEVMAKDHIALPRAVN